jgi:hypothetical protein
MIWNPYYPDTCSPSLIKDFPSLILYSKSPFLHYYLTFQYPSISHFCLVTYTVVPFIYTSAGAGSTTGKISYQ